MDINLWALEEHVCKWIMKILDQRSVEILNCLRESLLTLGNIPMIQDSTCC